MEKIFKIKKLKPLQYYKVISLQLIKINGKKNPAIPVLGIYLDKTLIQKDTCTPMFTAALFATVKT